MIAVQSSLVNGEIQQTASLLHIQRNLSKRRRLATTRRWDDRNPNGGSSCQGNQKTKLTTRRLLLRFVRL